MMSRDSLMRWCILMFRARLMSRGLPDVLVYLDVQGNADVHGHPDVQGQVEVQGEADVKGQAEVQGQPDVPPQPIVYERASKRLRRQAICST